MKKICNFDMSADCGPFTIENIFTARSFRNMTEDDQLFMLQTLNPSFAHLHLSDQRSTIKHNLELNADKIDETL